MADDISSQSYEIGLTKNIFEEFIFFKDEKIFSDVVVVVEEVEFPCHRVILAAASDFFKAALTTDMKEAKERRISLHGITKDVFSTLLSSIYGNKNVLTDDNFFDVWAAADMLRMRFIIAQLKEVFDSKLSSENCVDYLAKVRLLDQTAKQNVLEFIGNHFSRLKVQLKVQLLKVDELRSLLAMTNLNLYAEDEVIECALKWAKVNHISASQEPAEENSSDPRAETFLNGARSDSVNDLTDILECTRYLLISEGCLHGTLAMHPLVKSNPRCQSLVEKISYYHAHPHLHQSWCPPAAVHRERSNLANVLLVCQLTNFGQLQALDLRDMTWKDILIIGHMPNAKVLYYKSIVYVLFNNQLSKYLPKFEVGQPVPFSEGIIRVSYDALYVYTTDSGDSTQVLRTKLFNFSSIFNNGKLQYKSLGCIGEGMIDGKRIVNVILIGPVEIIFCVGDEDSYTTIIWVNEQDKLHGIYPYQLVSSSRLVVFRHDKEAFALQENGCLWRIQLGDDLFQINITRELVLWDGEKSLNGAVLYNDQLMIVGDFQDQSEVSTMLDHSLSGVFHSVVMIKRSYSYGDGCPDIALAELPKNIL